MNEKTYPSGREMIIDLGTKLKVPPEILLHALKIYDEERGAINFDRIVFSVACLVYSSRMSESFYLPISDVIASCPVFISHESLNKHVRFLLRKRGVEEEEKIRAHVPSYLLQTMNDLLVPGEVYKESLDLHAKAVIKLISKQFDVFSYSATIIYIAFAKTGYYCPIWELNRCLGVDMNRVGECVSIVSKELGITIPSPSERIKWRRFSGPRAVLETQN